MGVAKQMVIAGALAGSGAIAIAKVPPWLVKRGEKATRACLDAAAAAHGDPSACRTGASFAIGAAFPHVRIHAGEVRERLSYQRNALAVTYALSRREGVHESVVAMLDHARSLATARDTRVAYEELFQLLAQHGAFAELAAIDATDIQLDPPDVPARAALVVGDVSLARQRILSGGTGDWRTGTAAGALACVLGQRERGFALLAHADHVWIGRGQDALGDTRIAALHCGGTRETLGFEPMTLPATHRVASLVALAYDPAFQSGRRGAFGMLAAHEFSIYAVDNVGAIALTASTEGLTPLGLLELADQLANKAPERFALTPWEVLRPEEIELVAAYVPPAWLDEAARRFERAADAIPSKIDDRDDGRDLGDAARDTPRPVLRQAAARMYRLAAAFRLRRGDPAHVADSLARDRALDPAALERAPIEIAADEPTAALATLDAWRAAHPDASDPERPAAELMRALALVATTDFAAAYDVASTLPDSKEVRWLQLATALATGKPAVTGGIADGEMSPGAWKQAIDAHVLAKNKYLALEGQRMLPLVMFVVAHAAKQAGREPEAVLDEYFASSFGSRSSCLARATVARWRKDEAAARRWDRCVATISTLMPDDHAAVLAGIAGLW